MSKKKKKNKKKQKVQQVEPRRKMPFFIAVIACLLGAALIVFLCCRMIDDSAKKSELCDISWVSTSAFNSSGDEIELSDIYNTDYTTYQGTLNFKDDGTFSLWLTPGTADDGTHSGKYSVVDASTISVTFDEGTESSFALERENNRISAIVVRYEDYDVYFTSQP